VTRSAAGDSATTEPVDDGPVTKSEGTEGVTQVVAISEEGYSVADTPTEEERLAEGVHTSTNRSPVTSAPSVPEDRRQAVPERRHAPAKDALASDRRVEDVLDRLAALSAAERGLVADAMADRWGIGVVATTSDEDNHAHTQCANLAALKSSLCHDVWLSYGGLHAAATALGFDSVGALQSAIEEFCEA